MPLLAASAAILMWSSLATLTVSLAGVPPLYLTDMSLFIGGALSIPWMASWSLDWRALAVGIYGQFTYHVIYIVALRSAPPVNANLVHDAWPSLILLMTPLTGQGLKLGRVHILASRASATLQMCKAQANTTRPHRRQGAPFTPRAASFLVALT